MTSGTQVERYHIRDFSLAGGARVCNPFSVGVSATFAHESGERIAGLPGFYDGNGTWKIRFSPTMEGVWRGKTESADGKLDGIELGPIVCVPNGNAEVRGKLGIDPAHPRRFATEEGAAFIPLGFELDWMFALHQSAPEAFRELIDRISDCGFNYIVTNLYAHTGFSEVGHPSVYGPPQRYVFGGTNERPDHSVLNVDFFRDFDGVIDYLHAKGMVVHLMMTVQNKQVSWPEPGSPEDDQYWRYVVSRYQAYANVVWDVGKEGFYLQHRLGGHEYTLERMRLIRESDAYHHLVTVHDSEASHRAETSAADAACDFVSDQIHLGDTEAYVREATRRFRTYVKPYLNIEYGYEAGAEKIKTYDSDTTSSWREVLLWTYAVYFGGGYPCYYYSNTAWDLIKFDPEPPGWRHYRRLSDLLRKLDFNALEPRAELASRGFCLADPGRLYLVFLPNGGGTRLDLTSMPESAGVESEWIAVLTGERESARVGEAQFMTVLENPFEDKSEPCVVVVRGSSEKVHRSEAML